MASLEDVMYQIYDGLDFKGFGVTLFGEDNFIIVDEDGVEWDVTIERNN